MLKIEIEPSFISKCAFELKESGEGWTFIFAKDAYEHWSDPGKIWMADIANQPLVLDILQLANHAIHHPGRPEWITINDGVSVQIFLRGKEYKFTNTATDSAEIKLIESLFRMAEETFQDPDCVDYLELLGEYFFDHVSIKEFDEEIYRLKIYGGLGIREYEIVMEKFEMLKTKKKAILDMTNFLGIGRALNGCFLQLKSMEGLQVLTNKQSQEYLEEIGFDMSKTQRRK